MIERLGAIESGEWCKSREPMIRDYVAGTATEESARQVNEHLRHCRGCSSLTARLRSHLHEFGAVAAVLASGNAESFSASFVDRIIATWDGLRLSVAEKVDQASAAVGSIASSGGLRGSGAAGAGVLAKLAGVGGGGKAALACLGVTAAAGACVATGVIPEVPMRGVLAELRRDGPAEFAKAEVTRGTPTAPAVALGEPFPLRFHRRNRQRSRARGAAALARALAGAAEEPTAPAAPIAASRPKRSSTPCASAAAPTPPPAPPTPSSSGSSGSSGQGSIAAEEFGP